MHRARASAKLASTQNRFTPGRAVFVSCSQLADASTQNALHFDEWASGGSFDKETNLNYNYFRDYDPGTGRYVQSDPIGLRGGLNTYAYTFNNPLKYSDPDGLNPGVGCLAGAWAGPVGCGVGAGLVTIIGGAILMNTIGADDPKTKEREKEQCNPCQGKPSRTTAFMSASEYAGLGQNWTPIGWNQFNKPTAPSDQKLYTEFRQRIGNDPYGYMNPTGGEVVEHPADGHRPCPHFHAKRSLRDPSMIFEYDPAKP